VPSSKIGDPESLEARSMSGGEDPEKLLAKGTKLVSPNPFLLRFKPDYTAAIPLFEQAGSMFRMQRQW